MGDPNGFKRNVVAHRIIDVRQIPDWIIRVKSVALFDAPAIGEPAISVVFVARNLSSGLVEFICDAAIFVIIPACGLHFAVGQREQIAGRAIGAT